MNFAAVILAGGKSSRMGRDKAFLEIGGQTLLARQIRVAREIGAAEVLISGRANMDYSAFGCRVLQDKFPDIGPLAGIERALDATTATLLLVLAVDLPQMSSAFLHQLASNCSETCGAVPKLANHIEPLVAYYPKSAHVLATTQIAVGCLAARDFARQCVQFNLARLIELEAAASNHFNNWNLSTDLPCLKESRNNLLNM